MKYLSRIPGPGAAGKTSRSRYLFNKEISHQLWMFKEKIGCIFAFMHFTRRRHYKGSISHYSIAWKAFRQLCNDSIVDTKDHAAETALDTLHILLNWQWKYHNSGSCASPGTLDPGTLYPLKAPRLQPPPAYGTAFVVLLHVYTLDPGSLLSWMLFPLMFCIWRSVMSFLSIIEGLKSNVLELNRHSVADPR